MTTPWRVLRHSTRNILGLRCDSRSSHHTLRNCSREHCDIRVADLVAVFWHESVVAGDGDLILCVCAIVIVGISSSSILGVLGNTDGIVVFVVDFLFVFGGLCE